MPQLYVHADDVGGVGVATGGTEVFDCSLFYALLFLSFVHQSGDFLEMKACVLHSLTVWHGWLNYLIYTRDPHINSTICLLHPPRWRAENNCFHVNYSGKYGSPPLPSCETWKSVSLFRPHHFYITNRCLSLVGTQFHSQPILWVDLILKFL